jgi:hypothetical protein
MVSRWVGHRWQPHHGHLPQPASMLRPPPPASGVISDREWPATRRRRLIGDMRDIPLAVIVVAFAAGSLRRRRERSGPEPGPGSGPTACSPQGQRRRSPRPCPPAPVLVDGVRWAGAVDAASGRRRHVRANDGVGDRLTPPDPPAGAHARAGALPCRGRGARRRRAQRSGTSMSRVRETPFGGNPARRGPCQPTAPRGEKKKTAIMVAR